MSYFASITNHWGSLVISFSSGLVTIWITGDLIVTQRRLFNLAGFTFCDSCLVLACSYLLKAHNKVLMLAKVSLEG